MPMLQNWFPTLIHAMFGEVFVDPTEGIFCVAGEIYGDEKGRFEDGTYIWTSRCSNGINYDDHSVQTRNTLYKLGKPHEKYIQWCKEKGVDCSKFEGWE